MKLWTIQPIAFYEKLVANGEITASEKHAESDFKNAYNWMISQMENKIGARENNNMYPIWAWYQYKNSNSKKPDLRSSGFLPKETKGVRIEFEKPENEVLLSDFDLWHFPLNYWYIADNKQQEKEFDALLKNVGVHFSDGENYPPTLKKLAENSWNKIFNMNYNCKYVAEEFANKSIQATFWKLKINEVKKVDFFKAR